MAARRAPVTGAGSWPATSPLGRSGAALAWASRHDIGDLRVLAEAATDVLARRAVLFDPAPTIWRIEDRTLHEVTAAPGWPPG